MGTVRGSLRCASHPSRSGSSGQCGPRVTSAATTVPSRAAGRADRAEGERHGAAYQPRTAGWRAGRPRDPGADVHVVRAYPVLGPGELTRPLRECADGWVAPSRLDRPHRRRQMSVLSVGLAAVRDLDDLDDDFAVENSVDHPILASARGVEAL